MKTCSYLAATTVSTREELNSRFDKSTVDRIVEKTGPEKVYRTSLNVDTLDLSIKALESFRREFGDNEINEISNLLFVTENNRLQYPGNGYLFSAIGELPKKIFILDINSGCTGFVDALRVASRLAGKTMVVCAEAYSKNIRVLNRATSPIFSDGATVTVFDPAEWTLIDEGSEVAAVLWEAISCKVGQDMVMQGQIVFEFVNSIAIPLISSIIKKNKVDYLFLHQGSALVVNHIKKKLGSVKSNIPENICETGNLVSATIPNLIRETFNRSKVISGGTTLMLASFGVGLAASVIVLKKND